jgi:hypothetical protein
VDDRTPVQTESTRAPDSTLQAAVDGELTAPVVTQARGIYVLRNYQAVVGLLEPQMVTRPDLAGGQRVLALALAWLDRREEAVERLGEAVRQSRSDWLARASLASLLLGSPDAALRPDPVALLDEALATAPPASQPAVRELLGAARWRTGQEALRAGREREAAREFAEAGRQFARAAQASGAARLELPARQSASFVGQAVALLLAGETEAAQRLFSAAPLPRVAATDPLSRFAAGLYELCEELARAPAEERIEASSELRQVVLETRLAVGFFDGRRAVSMAWQIGTA